MFRIIIVDDHALFRVGLLSILKSEKTFEIAAEYKNSLIGPPLTSLHVDLALIDLSLESKKSGIDMVTEIKEADPSIKVVMLTSHKEEFYVINALRAGVDGYIHKDAAPDELISGLKKVLQGKAFYSAEIADILINNAYNTTSSKLPQLTDKERRVVEYLVEGFLSKEIAVKLNISMRTVEKHRSNILNKFKLRNTTELIKRLMELKVE